MLQYEWRPGNPIGDEDAHVIENPNVIIPENIDDIDAPMPGEDITNDPIPMQGAGIPPIEMPEDEEDENEDSESENENQGAIDNSDLKGLLTIDQDWDERFESRRWEDF